MLGKTRISGTSQTDQRCLYPVPSFLSKNQLAKEGPDSVAQVVIPALAPTLDKSLKSDRSLCSVRAMHYYLDRTSGRTRSLSLSPLKKVLTRTSHLPPSPHGSSGLILYHELSDQEALTLHQVKAHDVRAFAASKAFQ